MPTFKGNPVKLYGSLLEVGVNAPVVKLVGGDLGDVVVGGASGSYQLLSVVPSIDTGVCQVQTKAFNEKAASLSNVKFYCVSADLPFALGRFCGAEGLKGIVPLSEFRDKLFGKVYGLLLNDGALAGLLTRAVLVIDPDGKLVYQEVCEEITSEPNYEKALAAIK